MNPEGIPDSVFRAPLLRQLDERGRREVAQAGSFRRLGSGMTLYQAGETADSFFVVSRGEVRLLAAQRGTEQPTELRRARRGDSVGEEAALLGAVRYAAAETVSESELAEVPVAVFMRALTRHLGENASLRPLRALRRQAARDALASLLVGPVLPEADLDYLLDAFEWRSFKSRESIFRAGDLSQSAFFVVEGLVQLQRPVGERQQVCAYLSRGDLFGHEDALGGRTRSLNAVALGSTVCLEFQNRAVRSLLDRNPDLGSFLRRISRERETFQEQLAMDAQAGVTQHVFRDVYRMQMARSLLAIDQESCVRCGQCSWACAETHEGITRLLRRGDKIVTELSGESVGRRALLLPNSCQHCQNPACMIDCPTGAIGRDPEGEVFIRQELCTGCEACAKACPWENIAMAPRPSSPPKEGSFSSKTVAVKCDLCRDYAAPACVRSCPTQSILRLDPQQDFAHVRALFGGRLVNHSRPGPRKDKPAWLAPLVAFVFAFLLLAAWFAADRLPGTSPWRSVAGPLGALGFALLFSYAAVKRGIKYWLRPRARRQDEPAGRTQRSRVHPYYLAHLVLGVATLVLVFLHAGFSFSRTLSGALAFAFYLCTALGVFGAWVYRTLPLRLSRLERKGLLPEDFVRERERLLDRLHRHASGKSDLVKTLLERVIMPYQRSFLSTLSLLISGRSLSQEESRIRDRISAMLQGRGKDKLFGLEELIRTAVEQKALGIRRTFTWALRSWFRLHVIVGAIASVLLVLHILAMWH